MTNHEKVSLIFYKAMKKELARLLNLKNRTDEDWEMIDALMDEIERYGTHYKMLEEFSDEQ